MDVKGERGGGQRTCIGQGRWGLSAHCVCVWAWLCDRSWRHWTSSIVFTDNTSDPTYINHFFSSRPLCACFTSLPPLLEAIPVQTSMPEQVVYLDDRRYPGPACHPPPGKVTGLPTQRELDAFPRMFTWGELKDIIRECGLDAIPQLCRCRLCMGTGRCRLRPRWRRPNSS